MNNEACVNIWNIYQSAWGPVSLRRNGALC
jgi:hypothetical protein